MASVMENQSRPQMVHPISTCCVYLVLVYAMLLGHSAPLNDRLCFHSLLWDDISPSPSPSPTVLSIELSSLVRVGVDGCYALQNTSMPSQYQMNRPLLNSGSSYRLCIFA